MALPEYIKALVIVPKVSSLHVSKIPKARGT